MLKALIAVALLLVPGSGVVAILYGLRKLYVRYVHTNMEAEREGLHQA